MDLIRLANSAQSPTSLESKYLLEPLPYRGELRLGGRLVLLDKRAVHLELRLSAGRADGDLGAVGIDKVKYISQIQFHKK